MAARAFSTIPSIAPLPTLSPRSAARRLSSLKVRYGHPWCSPAPGVAEHTCGAREGGDG